ncbi:ATP-grasp domain-containing protein [Cellulophaga omnivescoria]|uniref:ATP-grasp domain-containing protein n=1 Tax=Cellulophaga omnivescoria TaxID=1888890 RepID=UPI000987B08A|nr:ATP-grasp domain-containing protein [Cellulophaga omnivescoria]
MEKINILFTCAGRRNYLINYFKEALYKKGVIIATDMQSNAPALVDADIAVTVPSIYDSAYINTLLTICKKYKVDAIISLNDLELPILSKSLDIFKEQGTRVILSSQKVINIAFDKWESYNFFKASNLHTPKTYIDYKLAYEDLKTGKLSFPLILKPRWGSASIGIETVYNFDELELVYKLQKIKLKNTILNTVSKNNIEEAILIQERIDGIEYGLDVLNDFNGNYYGTFAREKIAMRSGETDKAKSVINHEINKVGETISNNLGHIGNLDCDIFIKDNIIYVLELNPRFGGGYPFSHEAGINTAAIYIEWIKNNTNVNKFNNYKENITFAKCDKLLKV